MSPESDAVGEGERGDYRILTKLGEGWSADVYKAELVESRFGSPAGTTVVLKVYKGAIYRQDPNIRRRIERECSLITKLAHPNLVRGLGLDMVALSRDPTAVLVMEYCDGGNLADYFQLERDLSDETLLAMISGLASALAYVHQNHIVHRDIKPANILVDANGVPKLGDFGVARVFADTTVTGSDQFLGTIRYAAPEVLDGDPDSFASDVYSLGLVIYETLFGPPLTEIKRFSALIAKIIASGPTWPSSPDRFGAEATMTRLLLESVAKRMTVANPQARPTMGTVLEWLGAGQDAEPMISSLRENLCGVIRGMVGGTRQGESPTSFDFSVEGRTWFSVGYNATSVAKAMSASEIAKTLAGLGKSAIQGRAELAALATKRLPWSTYKDFPLDLRRLMATAFTSSYTYWIGQAPWDERHEISLWKNKFFRALKELVESEIDDDLRGSLAGTYKSMTGRVLGEGPESS